MKKYIAKSITIIISILMFSFTSVVKYTESIIIKPAVKKSIVVGTALISNVYYAQFTTVYNPLDSTCNYPGSWSSVLLYNVKDSIGVTNQGVFNINTDVFRLSKFKNTKNDGTPSSIIWLDNNGFGKRSPINSIPVSSNQVTLALGYIPIGSETQSLSLTSNSLSIKSGSNTINTVILPSGTTYTSGTAISISGSTITNTAPNATNTTSGYATGTVYNLTTTSAKVTFGTSSPSATITTAGTYLILSNLKIEYASLTTLGAAVCNFKLRRTNNTATDLSNASTNFNVPTLTALTQTAGDADIQPIIYTTSNNDDVIEMWGNRGANVTLGNIQVGEASIVIIRLY
ncbi:MAG: hypothetical protein V4547_17760 [Bacteroidota bacterium]